MKANAGAFIPRLKTGAFPRLFRKRLQQITAHDLKIYVPDTQIISNFTLARWHQFELHPKSWT